MSSDVFYAALEGGRRGNLLGISTHAVFFSVSEESKHNRNVGVHQHI